MPDADRKHVPSLDDRYELEDGLVFLSGTQALLRLMFEQKRRDARNGLNTASFVTGYPGSPLGGIDTSLRAAKPFLDKYSVRHLPAQNEELAATSLMGTQMIDDHPDPSVDGVVGYWYGKGPGVDRALDALKHGNFAGTSRHGAVVILSGEDHEAKSSTVPYQQEFAFEHAGVPVLFPASIAEFIEYGQHAVAMSRYSGCWVALKLVGPLCDGGQTISISPEQLKIVTPTLEIDGQPFAKRTNFTFFPVKNLETERTLYYERHAAVQAYARANALDRTVVAGEVDHLGIIAAGKSFTDTRQALADLGFDDDGLRQAGIRLYKIGMLCPLDSAGVRAFADGLDEVIVVEEKRDFLERQVGRALCDLENSPRIVGKKDEAGDVLFGVVGGFQPDQIASALGRLLKRRGLLSEGGERQIGAATSLMERPVADNIHRTPNFCSGCPHNTGTRLAPGQIAWGSPGCHIFAALMSEPTRRIEAVTQYGGEGLPWIGLSDYTSRPHLVQNVGDGSLYHSSYLNIRYAVSAGVSMTFKILDNGAIANTGGQQPTSGRSVPQLARLLSTEGVVEIAIVTKEKRNYRGLSLPKNAKVYEPTDMERVLREFEAVKGVTVVIYDGQCANERRRKQKRGLLPKPTKFTVVNEDVCENCGHCGEVANCMSLQKVDTEFGQKTRIHQSSCNRDQTCLEGECPSFVTVVTKNGNGLAKTAPPRIDEEMPTPKLPALDRPYHVYVPGLGGTGVITVNAILAQAATLDGNQAMSFDQTGAAQKWGPVLSSLIIAEREYPLWSNAVGAGKADLYLALDLMAAADKGNLQRCVPERTGAIINASILPNGEMIRNVKLRVAAEPMTAAISAVTDNQRTVSLDARAIAEALFGDYIMTNMVAVGAAYQAGLLPISAESMEAAITLNGSRAEVNILAFRAGRLAVADPDELIKKIPPESVLLADRLVDFDRTASGKRRESRGRLMTSLPDVDEETRAVLEKRVEDLIDYQSVGWAQRYVDVVARVAGRERDVVGKSGGYSLTRTVARNLHKLMAYKDEYEVARLLTQRTFLERAQAAFEGPVKIYFNLQPPLLRLFGWQRKVSLGPWIRPALVLLRSARRLRGSFVDPFRVLPVRRTERALIDWYCDLVDHVMGTVSKSNLEMARELLASPEDIRGYEHIKMANIKTVQAEVADKRRMLDNSSPLSAAAE